MGEGMGVRSALERRLLEAGRTACLRASLGQGTALLCTLCGRHRSVCSEVHRSAFSFLPTFGSDSALCSRSVSRLSSEVPSLPRPGGTVCPVAQVGFGCSGLLRCDEEGSRTAGGHGELCQRGAPLQPGGTATVTGRSLQAAAAGPSRCQGSSGLSFCWETPSPLPPQKK